MGRKKEDKGPRESTEAHLGADLELNPEPRMS